MPELYTKARTVRNAYVASL